MPSGIQSKAKLLFHTISEIADLLKVSGRTVWRWVATGELAIHRLGRSVRVLDADLRAFLASRRES
jgi:excisionase family DNA binding protein